MYFFSSKRTQRPLLQIEKISIDEQQIYRRNCRLYRTTSSRDFAAQLIPEKKKSSCCNNAFITMMGWSLIIEGKHFITEIASTFGLTGN